MCEIEVLSELYRCLLVEWSVSTAKYAFRFVVRLSSTTTSNDRRDIMRQASSCSITCTVVVQPSSRTIRCKYQALPSAPCIAIPMAEPKTLAADSTEQVNPDTPPESATNRGIVEHKDSLRRQRATLIASVKALTSR